MKSDVIPPVIPPVKKCVVPNMEAKAENHVFGESQEVDALYKLKQKLKSQTGASITFALLLFLVCAVVGSVVLTAGTAAAGRMSELAKMDQRYYSVTSAVQLLQDIISDQTIEVTEDGTASFRDEELPQPEFLLEAAKALVEKKSISKELSISLNLRNDGNGNSTSVTIPDVLLKETMDTDGNLVFDVCSRQANEPVYIIRMTFTPDKTELIDKNFEKDTETTTTIIRWKLNLLEKATSDGEAGGNG